MCFKSDDEIIEYYNFVSKNKKYVKPSSWNDDVLEYIKNRYDDSNSFEESLYRILNKINDVPLCKCCSKPTAYSKHNKSFNIYCSQKCRINDDIEYKNKIKSTVLLKYGVDNISKTDEIKQKKKDTQLRHYGVSHYMKSQLEYERYRNNIIQKYGVDNISKADEIKQKKKDTQLRHYGVSHYMKSQLEYEKYRNNIIQKYGVDNISKDDKIKQKKINTTLHNYGVRNPFQSELIKDKIRKTNILKYGVEHYSQLSYTRLFMSEYMKSKETQEHRYKLLKKHNTFNSSKPENVFYNEIVKIYPNTIRQYRSNVYPFNCDFYIPELDLYIELNYSWHHGYHPYNSNDITDVNKKNELEQLAKNSLSYKSTLVNWVYRDVDKLKCFKEHNLNYLIFYSEAEGIEWINKISE